MQAGNIVTGMVLTVQMLGIVYTGVCISKNKSGNIRLRNVVSGEGIEYLFNLRNPVIDQVEVISGYTFKNVRNKLYYLRSKSKRKITFKL